MRYMIPAACVAAALALVGCGGSPAPGRSCADQASQWKHTPGAQAVSRAGAILHQLSVDTAATNVTATALDLGEFAPVAETMAAHPVPACADPSGDWRELSAAVAAAAGEAAGVGSQDLAAVRRASGDMARISRTVVALTAELRALS